MIVGGQMVNKVTQSIEPSFAAGSMRVVTLRSELMKTPELNAMKLQPL